ncbi:MAG: sulfite reductase [Hyphomicrobiales bacterium]|nr:MAG: sulfite reductase [Hyphomicrobiales bacterium]
MAKAFVTQIVSANDLMEGDVVYLTTAKTWSRDIDVASIADTPEQAETLLAIGEAQQEIIVGAYLIEIERLENGDLKPLHFREKYRLHGPSFDYLAQPIIPSNTSSGV